MLITEWENIFGSGTSDQGLLTKNCKLLILINTKTNKQSNSQYGQKT